MLIYLSPLCSLFQHILEAFLSLRFYQPVGLEEGRGVLAMVYVGDLSGGVASHLLGVLPVLCLGAEVVEGEGQGF